MWLKEPAALHVYDLSMCGQSQKLTRTVFTQVTTCERGKFQPIASFFQISKKLNKPVSDRGNEMTYSCSVSAISAFRECVPVNIWGIEKYRQDTAITI